MNFKSLLKFEKFANKTLKELNELAEEARNRQKKAINS